MHAVAVLIAVALLPGFARSEVLPAALIPGAGETTGLLFSEGLALEEREELQASCERYEQIASALPDSAFIRWRISRNYWRIGERLPFEAKDERMGYFELARSWAAQALEIDPECGECMLWKLAALGRIATTGGVLRAAHSASDIADLIDRGIALKPTHADSDRNVTLANLYYAGSAFYRVVPDWFWLKWVIGVRGDKYRSLGYIRDALAITDSRIDYRVELGAVLLCIGHSERDEDRIAEGRRELRGAMELAHFQSTDQIDLGHARILYTDPERACGYSRDGWVDLREVDRGGDGAGDAMAVSSGSRGSVGSSSGSRQPLR